MDKVEIVNNLGNKVKVSKEFANAFNKAQELGKSRGESFGQFNEIPIEEFEETKEIIKSTLQDKMQSEHEVGVKVIKKSYTDYL